METLGRRGDGEAGKEVDCIGWANTDRPPEPLKRRKMAKDSALEEAEKERELFSGPNLKWHRSQAGNTAEHSELGPGQDERAVPTVQTMLHPRGHPPQLQ